MQYPSFLPQNSPYPGFVPGRWYVAVPGANYTTGSVLAANSVRLVPFLLNQSVTISDLGCRITTLAVGGNIRLAIYNSDPATKYPTTVAAETGNISTAAAASASADITGANVTLQPGLYWMAVNADTAAGTTAIMQVIAAGSSVASSLVGSATLGNVTPAATQTGLVFIFASTFGAFPDLTGQSLTESGGSGAWGHVLFKAA